MPAYLPPSVQNEIVKLALPDWPSLSIDQRVALRISPARLVVPPPLGRALGAWCGDRARCVHASAAVVAVVRCSSRLSARARWVVIS